MPRRRRQTKGYVRAEGASWLLTYRVYVWDPEAHKEKAERVTVTIGPSSGKGKLTKKQAEAFAWQHYLAPIDNSALKAMSTMTLAQFWAQRYESHLQTKKKYATQTQYKSLWKRWIEPHLGKTRLFELRPDAVDRCISTALAAKKGTATAKHIRKVVSAIVEHARALQMFSGDNPAQLVEIPDHVAVRTPHAMTVEQCRAWFAAVKDEPADPKDKRSDMKPLRTMSLLGVCCSLGVSEQLGLKWGRVNLTDEPVMVDGELLAPKSIAIRAHSYHGRLGSLKTGARKRDIPLPGAVVAALEELAFFPAHVLDPDAFVFSGHTGKPIWADNLSKRGLKTAATAAGMPWLSFHVFRHTCATLTKSIGMLDVDRRALMGHADGSMTDRYTHEDMERMRAKLEELAATVTAPPKKDEPEKLPGNVIVMKRRAG